MKKKKNWFQNLFSKQLASPISEVDPRLRRFNSKPLGTAGTEIYSGYSAEEYLATLRNTQRADTFDQMARGDYQSAMLLAAVSGPIKKAIYVVEPGDDSEEAKADAELIKHILFNDMEQTWEEYIDEVTSVIQHGHCVHEVTHKVVIDHPVHGSYNGILCLGYRSQRTLERWNINVETKKLKSVTQQANGDMNVYVDMPVEFLHITTIGKKGENWEGISMLRPCYGSWFRKEFYMKLNAIGVERFAIPTPIVKFPDGEQNSDQHDQMEEVLQAYTQHEQSFLMIPEDYNIDLKTNTYDPELVETSIDNEDKRMAKAFLAMFLELGSSSSSGSWALSTDQSDFFLSSIEHAADAICNPFNKKLIPKLIQMNRGERAVYPKLKATGISDKAGKELAEVLEKLAGVKILIPDDVLEKNVRERYGLPKPSTEGVREVNPRSQQTFGSTLAERIRLAERERLRGLK